MEHNTPEKDVCQPAVFDRLFLAISPILRNSLYYRTGDVKAAEDLVQDAFLRLWDNCSKVVPAKAKAYVFKIAENLFLNQKAHEKVVLKFQVYQSRQKIGVGKPDEVLEEEEFMDRLQRAIAALPNGARQVFLLNRLDGKTYREIAELLGISQKAVEKRMHRALVDLRKLHQSI